MNISHDLYERRPGYFILDLRTKEVYGGLNKHNWILKLKSYGITEEPELYEPSWRDEKLRRNEPQADIVE